MKKPFGFNISFTSLQNVRELLAKRALPRELSISLAIILQKACGFCSTFRRYRDLEGDVDKWKRDYVYLLQSSVTVPTGDLTDGMEVSLYGGNRVCVYLCIQRQEMLMGRFPSRMGEVGAYLYGMDHFTELMRIGISTSPKCYRGFKEKDNTMIMSNGSGFLIVWKITAHKFETVSRENIFTGSEGLDSFGISHDSASAESRRNTNQSVKSRH